MQLPTTSERRVKDVHAAKTLYGNFRKNSEQRRLQNAKVLNQLNGGKPFDDGEFLRTGQSWRINMNFRDASSSFEQVLVGYWRLLHDSSNLAHVTVRSDDNRADQHAQKFQSAFNSFVDDWGSDYVRNYLLFSSNHVGFGIGAALFPDTENPRWEVIRIGDLDVPERSKASVDKLENAQIRQEMNISELWDLIRTGPAKESAVAAGWNVGAIRKVIYHAIHSGYTARSESDYIAVEDEIRNNSLSAACENGPVTVVHSLTREYDGKISRTIFAPTIEHGDEYLFDDYTVKNRPAKLSEALACVFFEAGNGLFWGVKGFGQKNFGLSVVMNRMKSRAVDRTMLDGLNFRDMSDGVRSTIPITQMGPVNIFPKDLEQVVSYPQGRSILETIELLERQESNNNARYRDQSRQVSDTKTATQATILSNLQSQVDVANATLYLSQIANNLFTEQFRRLRKKGNDNPDAVKFKKRCLDSGMPPEIFHDAEIFVKTGSDPGAASASLQAQFAAELISMSASPHVNQRWAMERWVTTRFGAQAVSGALNPEDALGDIPAQRLALMENNDMGEGSPLPVAPSDNHREHIPVHLQPLQVMADQYRSSGRINPDSIIAMQNAIPHVEQHFEISSADKTMDDVRSQYLPIFTQIKAQAESIFRQLERMEAEAQASGAAPQSPGAGGGGGIDPAAAIGQLAPQ